MIEGTGQKLTTATIIVAGVGSLVATLMSIVSIWLQLKNYRKPLLQRYVVRILLMVPIYSIASWSSMMSTIAAQCLDPIRDIYEAFTIYTFFQLLINYLDGERALIIMTHGREPTHLLWPLNHVFPPIDISDPHSFLAVKRGILQYAWLKPILGLSAIIMKATGTYHEGKLALNSGYFWSSIIYNFSVTISLYSLGLFWIIMNEDLKPFRPVPKFLCVKLIIFASYWQGFFVSILAWLGVLDNVQGFTPDNLALAIQDALICVEMPAFAVAHWYAFSWHDFADDSVSAARMPVKYAVRDAFGIRDLIEDSKLTFRGDNYAYRDFDSNDKILAHEASRSRMGRLKAGMRYERGGKGKYWIASPDKANNASDVDPYTPLLGGNNNDQSNSGPSRNNSQSLESSTFEDPTLDPDMEQLYDRARQLEYGDWNYPVVPANRPSREERWRTATPISYQPVPNRVADYNARPSPGVNNGRSVAQKEPPTVTVTKKKGRSKNSSAPTRKRSQSNKKERAKPTTNTNDVSSDPSTPAPLQNPDVDTTKGDEETSRLWQQNDGGSTAAAEPEDTVISPTYDLQGEEFQNVWGSGDSQAEP